MIILGLVILIMFSMVPFFNSVVIEDGKTGKPLAFFDVKEGSEFSIEYIHSIHKTPVREIYHVHHEVILQTEMRFQEFGVGMPSGAAEGEVFAQKGENYILSNMKRTFPSLDIRIGQIIANHTLLLNGNKYPFSSFSEKGSWVSIKVEKLNVWQRLIGGKKLG
ncbi:DUF1850 domain-containing protein [Fictibacillus norfolkensis]|uniref:DUF1850 domain-containing protein n=1 Tax=Fictibacillus norfolkensis TaxID=2762233 RepID=A0ABR8SHZ7_9BACL|nr:DUF1850 domain-containing protein [Fictibacillus norfolkensis]MBD7963013.1 DUF1850 domain-containing protein [Fictibacillus norfolkensis]